jgi:colicin import membrane protein
MRRLLIAVALVGLLAGNVCASGDEISRQLEQEALAVTNSHKAKADAEEAAQREKDAEIEAQRKAQAEELKEEKLLQEELKKEAEQAEKRAKAEEELKKQEELELQRRVQQEEIWRKQRVARIRRDMNEALRRVDAKWNQIRASERQREKNAMENARRDLNEWEQLHRFRPR